FESIHAKESAQSATVRAEQAREQLLDKNLNETFEKANAAMMAARDVANNTPVELKSAHMAFDQAKARYQAGLTPIDDLAQAQRLLVQAEVDDSIARLNIWRALLQLGAARGDLNPSCRLLTSRPGIPSNASRSLSPKSSALGYRGAHCRSDRLHYGNQPDARGHLSGSGKSRHLRRAAIWRNDACANGRVRNLLLRVPLPLHHRNSVRRQQKRTGRHVAQADLS